MRKRFFCSYDRIELVITYVCNMKCFNCDAMVTQAPSEESMTIEQIKKFIQETLKKKVYWKHIRVLGGEPTLHKHIFEILDLLLQYKNAYSSGTKIQLVTNGHGKTVKNRISKAPKGIEIENTEKTSNIQAFFSPINKAPIDIPEYKNSDFTKGCWIPTLCGITLDMHGYYPCSAAAAIDRVFGFDVGKKALPNKREPLECLFEKFCRLCGHFYDEINSLASTNLTTEKEVYAFEKVHRENFERIKRKNFINGPVISPVWVKALENYKQNRPVISNY